MASDDYDPFEVSADEVLVETDAALLCVIEGDEHWIPKSQIEGDLPKKGDDNVTFQIPTWLAKKRGLV